MKRVTKNRVPGLSSYVGTRNAARRRNPEHTPSQKSAYRRAMDAYYQQARKAMNRGDIKAADLFVRRATTMQAKYIKGKRNPLPAILAALETGAGTAIGGAAGMEAFESMKKKKNQSPRGPSGKSRKKKRSKSRTKNPRSRVKSQRPKARKSQRNAQRITHALGIGAGRSPRIIAAGTASAIRDGAQLLREAGVKNVRVGKRS